MSERQHEIMQELGTLLESQRQLFEELPRAIRIAQIWPDAFYNGSKCTPCLIGINDFKGTKPKFPEPYNKIGTVTRTYLKRADGIEYDITTEDFLSIINAGP